MRIRKQYYNDEQMTTSNSLANALLDSPEQLSPVITHLAGRSDQRFPLTMLTEGVGNSKSIDKDEYTYKVQTSEEHTRPVAETPANTGSLGAGGSMFTLTFPDRWFIKDYILISQSGVQARVMSEPTANGSNWDYQLQLVSPDPNMTMPAEDVQKGALFGQLFAAVGKDFSRGNASNWSTPGEVGHKLSTLRKSYEFAGRAKNHVAEFALPKASGEKTKLWMDWEEYKHMRDWKKEGELYLWYGQQSYNQEGVTMMRDENGQPVQIGPGILEQIDNKDTYSELTENKLKNTIGDLFYGMSEAQNMTVTLYTGTGGMREFDSAMKQAINDNKYQQFNDGVFVSGSGRELSLGSYFTQYKHVDGHTVNVVKVPHFDKGPFADARKKHPKTGYSLESYRMVFVDQSTYDGQANLQMINKKGREMLRWAVPGSVVPNGFDQSTSRASDIDGASVHFLKEGGVVLKRFDTSLDLQCVAA